MKKIFLMLLLLFSCCFIFTSCNKSEEPAVINSSEIKTKTIQGQVNNYYHDIDKNVNEWLSQNDVEIIYMYYTTGQTGSSTYDVICSIVYKEKK